MNKKTAEKVERMARRAGYEADIFQIHPAKHTGPLRREGQGTRGLPWYVEIHNPNTGEREIIYDEPVAIARAGNWRRRS